MGVLAGCLALGLTAVASLAMATETSREEYKAQVEPICKADKQASEKYLKGVKTLVRQDKLKQAGSAFTRAAAALEKAERQLALVPQPEADSAKLGKWLAEIKGEVALMKRIAAKFNSGDKAKASSLAIKLTHNATTANNQVIAFQFNYCKIDPAKLT